MAAGPDGTLCWFVTDTANKHVLTTLGMFLQDQIRVIGYLSHLHNQPKDVGVVIEHNTTTNVGVKLPGGVCHDAGREVAFNLTKELVMNDHPAVMSEYIRGKEKRLESTV
jgi:hypothetical protein